MVPWKEQRPDSSELALDAAGRSTGRAILAREIQSVTGNSCPRV